jgi:hypothetical protein
MDGWTLAVFAFFTFVLSIGSVVGMTLGLGMGIVAWRELTQGKALSRLEPASPKKLAVNQLFLGGMLIVYAVWSLLTSTSLPSELTDALKGNPDSAEMLGSVEQLVHWISVLVYVLLILIAIFVQGGTAWYYHSRDKLLRDYLQKTPQWILDMQRQST